MKKLLLACVIGLTSVLMTSDLGNAAGKPSTSQKGNASDNLVHANSKYCHTAQYDPLCMNDKMFHMRSMMMQMTQPMVMKNRTKYCRGATNAGDPLCKPNMMHSTYGY